MPAVAIVGAVGAIGFAASTGFTIAATIAAVGATIAAVGAVTKSKELMIAGGVLGAVGAIGGLASSAGLFGAGGLDGLFSSGSAAAAGAAEGVSFVAPGAAYTAESLANSGLPGVFAGFDSLPGATSALDGLKNAGSLVDMISGAVVPPGGNEQIAPGSSGQMGDIIPPTATDTGPKATGVNDPASQPGLLGEQSDPAFQSKIVSTEPPLNTVTGIGEPVKVPAAPAAPAAPTSQTASGARTPAQQAIDTMIYQPVTGAITKTGGTGVTGSPWAKIMETLGKPGIGVLASGVVQAGASFLSGATSELTPAQIRALEAQAQANQAAANLSNQQSALLQMQQRNNADPIPMATNYGQVTKTAPVQTTPRATGLMNTPPKLAPVTGVPA